MRRLWPLLALGALVGAAVAALLLARGPADTLTEDALLFRGRSVAIEARVTPRVHAFGESVTAEVTAIFNRGLVKPGSVRVRTEFDPYTQIGTERRTREDEGELTRIRWRYRLQCITRPCLPGEPKRTFEFEQGRLEYTLTSLGFPGSGGRSGSRLEWPPVEVASRLEPGATTGIRWRAETRALPDVSYRVHPTLAVVGLFGASGLLAAAGLALLAPLAPRRRTPEEEAEAERNADPLERALELLRGATNGDAADRRRALELVARELGRAGEHDLAARSTRLAWSKEPPSAAEAAALAEEVER